MAKLSKEDRDATIRAADETWWRGWWETDFSWKGLASLDEGDRPRHPWTGWKVTPDNRCLPSNRSPEDSRPATLQDYFRWDFKTQKLRDNKELIEAGLLIQERGRPYFHIFHLPERWANGKPSWKAELGHHKWKIVAAELKIRLRAADRTVTDKMGNVRDSERRALLTGSQLLSLPCPSNENETKGQLDISANWTRWLVDAEFSGFEFRSSASFEHAIFSGGKATFESARLSGGRSSFNSAFFLGGNANFDNSHFCADETNFNNAQFLGGDASFKCTVFSGVHAKFESAEFSGGDANFIGSKFSEGKCSFNLAQFSGGEAIFMQAEFSGGDASFQDAVFSGGSANFHKSQFSGGVADFDNARFSFGPTYFDSAKFSGGKASFVRAHFSGGKTSFRRALFYGGHAKFRNAVFRGDYANFLGAEFGQPEPDATIFECDFDGARFENGFSGIEANFHGPTTFRGVEFLSDARFGNARQTGVRSREVIQGARFHDALSFRDARFRGPADFARTRFPDRADHRTGSFEGARFHDTLDMKGVERLPFSAFQGAILDKGLLLAPRHPDETDFNQALTETRAAIERDREITTEDGYSAAMDADSELRGPDARYAALEKGCLVLKHAMAQVSDRQREQAFHRLELIAREKRPARLSGPLKRWEKRDARISLLSIWASRLYGLLARHGASSARPLICLVVAGGLFSAAYFPLGLWAAREAGKDRPEVTVCGGCPPHPLWAPALEMAGRNTLGPLKFAVRRSLPFENDLNAAPSARLVFSLVSASHSLLSLVLIFLAALGLRRKFQL